MIGTGRPAQKEAPPFGRRLREARLARGWTQAELAGKVGGSRESVNRLLADFVARGLIRFEPDTLVVPDARRLTQEARR
jgi:transcriptional regulator with XRE-family HTH domain